MTPSVKEFLELVQARMIREEHTEWEAGYNAALKKIANDITVKFDLK